MFQLREETDIIASLESQIEVLQQNRSVLESEFSKLVQ